MTAPRTRSIDAMGGDNAPRMVVEGIEVSLDSPRQIKFLLFGNQANLSPLLKSHPRAAQVSEIRHTEDVISNEEKAGVALRAGRDSSMRLAINTVGSGEADGMISAGNTGALMAMAKFVLKTLPGIDRPAIATYYPTQRGESVMLDLGANVDCDADNLVQFAVMGEVFARNVRGLEKPSIGILNVGAENLKGNEAVQKAAITLQESSLPIEFYGFVEGDDIGAGTVDVVVTDGFTGNVALKTAEGTVSLFSELLKQSLSATPMARIGAFFARNALRQFKMSIDPRRYNGAMFLGLNGICIKSHGGTDGVGFANAIHVAVELILNSFNDGIKEDYAKLSIHAPALKKVVGGE